MAKKDNKKEDGPLHITLEEYINNPYGKGNSTVPAIVREATMNSYKQKFDNLMLRENGKIKYFLFQNKEANEYYSLVKVPSEIIPKFYYDVVIKFYATADVKDAGRTMKNYYVQFFSNDPAFNYTYAYVFNKKGLLIPELKGKILEQCLKEEPKERNPEMTVGYVKSIVFAYLFLNQRGLLLKASYRIAEDYTPLAFKDLVMDSDSKIEDREREDKLVDHRKKKVVSKALADKIQSYGITDAAKNRLVTTTKRATTVKKTKAINGSRKSRVVKKI